jgi:hypothetical protein
MILCASALQNQHVPFQTPRSKARFQLFATRGDAKVNPQISLAAWDENVLKEARVPIGINSFRSPANGEQVRMDRVGVFILAAFPR